MPFGVRTRRGRAAKVGTMKAVFRRERVRSGVGTPSACNGLGRRFRGDLQPDGLRAGPVSSLGYGASVIVVVGIMAAKLVEPPKKVLTSSRKLPAWS